MANFHQASWKGQADLVAPLTTLSPRSKGKLATTPQLITAFDAIKRLVLENAPLAFPDPNLPCDVHANTSDLQPGAAIKQQGNTIAFFSRKSSTAWLKCPATEKEVLCIVEALEECCSVLWGAKVSVCTDCVDLTCNTITSNRIVTQRMLCEEFNPIFHCIEGPDNLKAGALLRLPFATSPEEKRGVSAGADNVKKKKTVKFADSNNPFASNSTMTTTQGATDSKKVHVPKTGTVSHPTDPLINHPSDLPNFPIAFPRLEQAQQQDKSTQNATHHSDEVSCDCTLKVHKKNDGSSKIVLPDALVDATIKRHHHTLGRAGADGSLQAMSQFLHSPGLKDEARAFCGTCDACQRHENACSIGHVPPRNESMVPSEQIATDAIGPWSHKVNGVNTKINTHTIVCACSNPLEIKQATWNNPTGKESV